MRFLSSSWGLGGGDRPLNQSFCHTKTYLATLTNSNLHCKKSIHLWIVGCWSHWLLTSPLKAKMLQTQTIVLDGKPAPMRIASFGIALTFL